MTEPAVQETGDPVPVRIGLMQPGHRAFVVNTWTEHYRHSSVARPIFGPVYFHEQRRLVDALLDAKGVVSIVASNPADESHVLGWLVAEPGPSEGSILHYAFVKEVMRGFGIFGQMRERLTSDLGEVRFLSHLPPREPEWVNRKLREYRWTYDPYVLCRR